LLCFGGLETEGHCPQDDSRDVGGFFAGHFFAAWLL
jgi:hypothetical protein